MNETTVNEISAQDVSDEKSDNAVQWKSEFEKNWNLMQEEQRLREDNSCPEETKSESSIGNCGRCYYVSSLHGDDANDGPEDQPLKSLYSVYRLDLQPGDLPAVRALVLECFSYAWSEKLLLDLLTSSWDKAWVLKEDDTVRGYSNFRVIAGEGELMRIAVHGACRGRGYGRLLMERLLREAEEENVEDITKEVRASTAPANALYEAYGFQKEAVRKNYYSGPTEDALIYWKRSGKSIDR